MKNIYIYTKKREKSCYAYGCKQNKTRDWNKTCEQTHEGKKTRDTIKSGGNFQKGKDIQVTSD